MIYEAGYTISFYPRNIPAPKKLVNTKYSPTHLRMLVMLDTLQEKYDTYDMDYLFISANFLRECYADTNEKAIVHGVCCASGRFLTPIIIQVDNTKGNNKADIVLGEIRASVLRCDLECKDEVAFSV